MKKLIRNFATSIIFLAVLILYISAIFGLLVGNGLVANLITSVYLKVIVEAVLYISELFFISGVLLIVFDKEEEK